MTARLVPSAIEDTHARSAHHLSGLGRAVNGSRSLMAWRGHARWRRVLGAACAACAGLALSAGSADAATTNLYVSASGSDVGGCGSAADACATVGYALTQGTAGDTINVGAGTFDENQMLLTYPVTIAGAGAGSTTIDVDGSAAAACSSENPSNVHAVTIGGCGGTVGAGSYALTGVTLEGVPDPNDGTPDLFDADGLPANVSIMLSNDAFLTNTTLDPSLASDAAVGVLLRGNDVTDTVTVESDTFSGMYEGVYAYTDPGDITVSQDTFTNLTAYGATAGNPYPSGSYGPLGIYMEDTFNASGPAMDGPYLVSDNTFSGYSGFGVFVAAGQGYSNVSGAIANVTISGNTFDLPVTSDGVVGTTAAIDLDADTNGGNTLSNIDIAENSISSSGTGAADVTLLDDPGSNPANTVSGISITGNSLLGGSGVIGVGDPNGAAPTATGDWWGCATGPNSGDCTTASSSVVSTPYLTTSDGLPTAPSGVGATAGVESATINWDPPALSGTSQDVINSYTVTAVPGGASVTVPGTSTSATISGLTAGDTYAFTVNATGPGGTGSSGSSPGVTALPTPATPAPSPPVSTPVAPSPVITPDAPSGIAPGALGTPVSTSIQPNTQSTVTIKAPGGVSDLVAVPPGALPAGTIISIYPVTNATTLTRSLHTGLVYITAFAVAWKAPNGGTPTATKPIMMTVQDHRILAGDTVYQTTTKGLKAVGTAKADGLVAIKFTADPGFVIASVPRLSFTAKHGTGVRNSIKVALRCSEAAACHGTATITVAHTVKRGTRTMVSRLTIAKTGFALARGRTASIGVRLTAQGKRVLSGRKARQEIHASVTTTLTGGTKRSDAIMVT